MFVKSIQKHNDLSESTKNKCKVKLVNLVQLFITEDEQQRVRQGEKETVSRILVQACPTADGSC